MLWTFEANLVYDPTRMLGGKDNGERFADSCNFHRFLIGGILFRVQGRQQGFDRLTTNIKSDRLYRNQLQI